MWSMGHDTSTKSAHMSLGPNSSSFRYDPGQTDREECDEYMESPVRGQCLFVMSVGIGDWSYRATPMTATWVWGEFFLTVSPLASWRFSCQVYPQKKTSKQVYHGGWGGGGAAAVAATQPRSSLSSRSWRSELLVTPRNRAYEYEYYHTLRKRRAIPLVGSQPA